jgi:putative restriction endonuclease
MPAVGDYLNLTAADARLQWRAIDVRLAVAGRRQVDFTPVETLLCLAASLVVNHRRYGGSTSHLAEEPVPSLARLFRRPNSSVLAKMANLDGSRRHGAKHEVEVATRLLGTPNTLASTYRVLLASARQVGIGEDRLPDFLNLLEEDGEFLLLGQEELALSELEESVQPEVDQWAASRSDVETTLTERLLVARSRIGQHRFATAVLHNHHHQCTFCGLRVRVDGRPAPRMLVASHIKPWRHSSPRERLDPRNGLTACPTHDVAFDTGLLMVDDGLRIHVAPQVEGSTRGDPALRAVFGRPPLADRLLLPTQAPPPDDDCLAWHRGNVFHVTLR